jgi:hypothetical protein
MLLSINEAKIAELLESGNSGPFRIENYELANPMTTEVYGTVYGAPVLVTPETRERLMAARRQVEESGVPLKRAEELTREIDEMRGRG